MEALLKLTMLIIMGWMLFTIPVFFHTKGICLSKGYTTASVSFDLTGYCIKRVNQTDIVTPLSEVE